MFQVCGLKHRDQPVGLHRPSRSENAFIALESSLVFSFDLVFIVEDPHNRTQHLARLRAREEPLSTSALLCGYHLRDSPLETRRRPPRRPGAPSESVSSNKWDSPSVCPSGLVLRTASSRSFQVAAVRISFLSEAGQHALSVWTLLFPRWTQAPPPSWLLGIALLGLPGQIPAADSASSLGEHVPRRGIAVPRISTLSPVWTPGTPAHGGCTSYLAANGARGPWLLCVLAGACCCLALVVAESLRCLLRASCPTASHWPLSTEKSSSRTSAHMRGSGPRARGHDGWRTHGFILG